MKTNVESPHLAGYTHQSLPNQPSLLQHTGEFSGRLRRPALLSLHYSKFSSFWQYPRKYRRASGIRSKLSAGEWAYRQRGRRPRVYRRRLFELASIRGISSRRRRFSIWTVSPIYTFHRATVELLWRCGATRAGLGVFILDLLHIRDAVAYYSLEVNTFVCDYCTYRIVQTVPREAHW